MYYLIMLAAISMLVGVVFYESSKGNIQYKHKKELIQREDGFLKKIETLETAQRDIQATIERVSKERDNAVKAYQDEQVRSAKYRDDVGALNKQIRTVLGVLQPTTKPTTDILCPDDCIHLNITEAQQNELKQHGRAFASHWCNRYQRQLKHGPHHPQIMKCEACLGVTK